MNLSEFRRIAEKALSDDDARKGFEGLALKLMKGKICLPSEEEVLSLMSLLLPSDGRSTEIDLDLIEMSIMHSIWAGMTRLHCLALSKERM